MGWYDTYYAHEDLSYYIVFFIITFFIGVFLMWQVYPQVTWTHWGSGRGALGALFIVFSIIGVLAILVRAPGLFLFSVFILTALIVIAVGAVAFVGVTELYPIRVVPTVIPMSPGGTVASI